MTYTNVVQIGRVVFISEGKFAGKLAVIVEIIDQNRALVDGPCTKVGRHALNFRLMQLTKFVVPISHGARTKTVQKAWEKSEVQKKWETTAWCKKLHSKELKIAMTDLDRFKLMKAKQARNRVVKAEFNKLKRVHYRTAAEKRLKSRTPKKEGGGAKAKK